MTLLAAVADGFKTIDAEAALKDRALEWIDRWLNGREFSSYSLQLRWMINEKKWPLLLDSFYQVLPFGTGGRRGAMGVGPNRMNLWTLGASVQGHSQYLKQRFPGKSLTVVIAYDVRKYLDQRKLYNPELPNPIMGLSSKDLAHYAAGVYAANEIHVHLLPDDSTRYLATPELSFTIRYLKAHGGLNISASHNPPDDNGGKFYDERGGQPVPPDDQIMSELVEKATDIRSLPWPEVVRGGLFHALTNEPHQAYIDLCKKQSLVPAPKFDEIRVVFTPLHGVGSMTAYEVLQAQGFRPIPVESQMKPDGQFTNVTKSPNPEVPESMDRAEELAKEQQADLVLATDPDADRLGGMSSDGRGNYRLITGNEIAALLTWFKLSQLKAQNRMPPSPVVITTEVTTSLITRIARAFESQVVNNLQVGFKNMAQVLWLLESEGQYEDVRAKPSDLILASEESHGVLAMPEIRDKDAAAGCLLLAELALFQKRQGKTIGELLNQLAEQFGYFRNEGINIVMAGIEGKSNMMRMLDSLRKNPPKTIAGRAVTHFEDLLDENGRLGPIQGATDALGRNFLIFKLGDGAKICLRPSGTEPKAKAYVEACSEPKPQGMTSDAWHENCRKIDRETQELADEFLKLALATVNQKPEGKVKLSR